MLKKQVTWFDNIREFPFKLSVGLPLNFLPLFQISFESPGEWKGRYPCVHTGDKSKWVQKYSFTSLILVA